MPKKSKKNIKNTNNKKGCYNFKKSFNAGNRIKGKRSSKKLRKKIHKSRKYGSGPGFDDIGDLSFDDVYNETYTEEQERRKKTQIRNGLILKFSKQINNDHPNLSKEKKVEMLRNLLEQNGVEGEKQKKYNITNREESDLIPMPIERNNQQKIKPYSIWRFPPQNSKELKQPNILNDTILGGPKINDMMGEPYLNQYITSPYSPPNKDDKELSFKLLYGDDDSDHDSDHDIKKPPKNRSRKKTIKNTHRNKYNSIQGAPKTTSMIDRFFGPKKFPSIQFSNGKEKKGFSIKSNEGSLLKSSNSKSNELKPKSKKST